MNANGSVDTTFDPNVDSAVNTLVLQPDGKIAVGGNFSSFTPNGGSVVTRHYIALLNADGSVDSTFDPNANGEVEALATQPDGKLVVGGYFGSIGGETRNYLARLSTAQAALQSLQVIGYSTGGSVVTWTRSGGGPELALPPVLTYSTGGITYAPEGTMQRIGAGWRYSGFVPPLGQDFYLRTQGLIGSGFDDGGSGLIEDTLRTYLGGNDGIFANGFQ